MFLSLSPGIHPTNAIIRAFISSFSWHLSNSTILDNTVVMKNTNMNWTANFDLKEFSV